jgi:hypothetical protein
MLMRRRLCLHARRNRVCCFREMVVPVRMCRTTAVPMNMDMAREDGCIASGRRQIREHHRVDEPDARRDRDRQEIRRARLLQNRIAAVVVIET